MVDRSIFDRVDAHDTENLVSRSLLRNLGGYPQMRRLVINSMASAWLVFLGVYCGQVIRF